jgi:hypothetical protein
VFGQILVPLAQPCLLVPSNTKCHGCPTLERARHGNAMPCRPCSPCTCYLSLFSFLAWQTMPSCPPCSPGNSCARPGRRGTRQRRERDMPRRAQTRQSARGHALDALVHHLPPSTPAISRSPLSPTALSRCHLPARHAPLPTRALSPSTSSPFFRSSTARHGHRPSCPVHPCPRHHAPQDRHDTRKLTPTSPFPFVVPNVAAMLDLTVRLGLAHSL